MPGPGGSLEELLGRIPAGVELDALEAEVASDLADARLFDHVAAGDDDPEQWVRAAAFPRVRPILVALAARAAGAVQVDADTQHVAELLHRALVVHDLTLGREGGRRRALVRKLLRRSADWFGGNHLVVRSLELARVGPPAVLGALVDTLRDFANAQELGRRLRQAATAPTEADWEEHADLHSGALLGFCCRAGGHLAAAPTAARQLGRYGLHLGRVWHIAEDLAGLQLEEPGRHLLVRALVGRPILPLVYEAQLDPAFGRSWGELMRDPSPSAADALARRVSARALALARERLVRESWAARQALLDLPASGYRARLDQLAAGIARASVPRSG